MARDGSFGLTPEEIQELRRAAKKGYAEAVAADNRQRRERAKHDRRVNTGNANEYQNWTPEQEREARRRADYGKLPDGTEIGKMNKKQRREYEAALRRTNNDPSRVSMSRMKGSFEAHRTAGAAKKSQASKNAAVKAEETKVKKKR